MEFTKDSQGSREIQSCRKYAASCRICCSKTKQAHRSGSCSEWAVLCIKFRCYFALLAEHVAHANATLSGLSDGLISYMMKCDTLA